MGKAWKEKEFWYWGMADRFATGCELLRAGAAHVILSEYKVTPDHIYNRALVENYPQILDLQGSKVVVNPNRLTVLEGDIRSIAAQNRY